MSKLGLASLMHGYSTGLNLAELTILAETPRDSCASFLNCLRLRSIADLNPVGDGRYTFSGEAGDYERVNEMTQDLDDFLSELLPAEVMLEALSTFSGRKWKRPGWWCSDPEFDEDIPSQIDPMTGVYYYRPEDQFNLGLVGTVGVPPGCRNQRSAYGSALEVQEAGLRAKGVVTTTPLLWAYALVNNNRANAYLTDAFFDWEDVVSALPSPRRR